jgi:hypothetical protein
MSEKKRRIVSLVVLALFITIVGFANSANAGGGGGNNAANEAALNNFFYSAFSNR